MNEKQNMDQSMPQERLDYLAALSPLESVTMLAGKLTVQDVFGRTYTYLGNPADVTPDDIMQMQNNPPADQNRVLRNIDDLRAWRAMHGLDPNGYTPETGQTRKGRANRKKRIAHANAKRK
jgi:hypothetical protein